MQSALQPYATAGVTIVGASLIAVTPVAAPLPDLAGVQSPAVQLTATGFDAWTDQLQTTAANFTTLWNNFALAPFVSVQQQIVDLQDAAAGLKDGSLTPNDVAQQMQAQLDAVLTGFTLQHATGFPLPDNTTDDTAALVTQHTLSASDITSSPPVFGHDLLFELLPALLPADQAKTIVPIVDFLSSPLSGILIGAVGPFVSPFVAGINTIEAIANDPSSALQDLIAAPANVVGSFFNGATLDLSGLIPLIDKSGILPLPPGTIDHLDLAFGGLLSPGSVAPIYQLVDDSTTPPTVTDTIPAAGGSIFNSLGLNLNAEALLGAPLNISIDSHGVGPIGALLGWDQAIGALRGSGWDGKGDVTVKPPIFGLPLIPTDVDDGGTGTAAAVDSTGLVQEFATALGL